MVYIYISNLKKFDGENAVMSVISKKRKLFGVVSGSYTAERTNISAIIKEKATRSVFSTEVKACVFCLRDALPL